MKRGWLLAAAGVVLLLLGGAACVYEYNENLFNPSYRGKRADAWADQAMHDPNPAARTEAAEALVVLFRQMKYGRIQLVMRFCYARRYPNEAAGLPKEVLPFLIEALHAPEIEAPGSYQAIALSQVEGTAAVAPLVEVVLHDDDPHARAGAVAALRMIGHGGNAGELLLLRAAREGDEETRRRAEEALK